MKRVLVLGALLAASSFAAEKKKALVDQISGQNYGMAGCGLGSIVFADKPGMIQVVAATLNGVWGSQTFGITSGTSNCVNSDKAASLFIDANRVALAGEISKGAGETISGLASIYGCSDDNHVGAALKKNYNLIFPQASTETEVVRDSIRNILKNDQVIAGSCKRVG